MLLMRFYHSTDDMLSNVTYSVIIAYVSDTDRLLPSLSVFTIHNFRKTLIGCCVSYSVITTEQSAVTY